MTRVSALEPTQLDSAVVDMLDPMVKKWGTYITAHLIYARRPSVLKGLLALNDGLNESGLIDARLAALVNRRVASVNSCPA